MNQSERYFRELEGVPPNGVYPTLNEWAIAIAEVKRDEEVAALRRASLQPRYGGLSSTPAQYHVRPLRPARSGSTNIVGVRDGERFVYSSTLATWSKSPEDVGSTLCFAGEDFSTATYYAGMSSHV